MSNEVAFANWWATEFPDLSCPPVPRQLDELGIPAADFDCDDSELFESENPKT